MNSIYKYALSGVVVGCVSITSAAISWPAAPSGEPSGGLFMTYINKMLVNPNISTTDGKVKKAADADSLGSGAVVVNASGNVGVGTSSPQAKLDINGQLKTDAIQIGTGATIPGWILTSDENGNGTWQPNNYRTKVVSMSSDTFNAGRNTCVVMNDNPYYTNKNYIKCWGLHDYGQLGIGSQTSNRFIPTTVPIKDNVSKVYALGRSNYALMNDGTVYSWGYNVAGQIGDGTTTNAYVPYKIPTLSNVTELYMGSAPGGTSYNFLCAKIGTGATSTAKCWGYNGYGQLGDGTTVQKNIPTDVVGLSNIKYMKTSGFGGGGHTCALLNDGNVKCWGYNAYGQLGDGTTVNKSVPTLVSGLSGVRDIYLGDGRTCAVLSDNVTLKCWGYNNYGQIGDGTTVNKLVPTTISTGGGVIKEMYMAAYDYFSNYILFADGTLKATGYNGAGQLGDGTLVNKTGFVSVSGLTGVKEITGAGVNGYQFMCALINDGTVKCWGHNANGFLGDGTVTNRSVPTQVLGLDSAIDIKAAGGLNTGGAEGRVCAILSDFSMKCWGYNGQGQLGQSDTINYYIPSTVKNLNTD